MNYRRIAALITAIWLIALLACCGKTEKTKGPDTGITAEQADTEGEGTDLAQDSEREETGQKEKMPSMDLFWEDGDICTQFYRLSVPGEWEEDVTCHYFQEPEAGRYELNFVENTSVAATEGTGGRVFSIVLSEDCPEEPPGETYDYLGTLSGEGEELFHVLIVYPEGTQYTEASESSYKKALDIADEAAGRLEGRSGFIFEEGEYPGNTED